MSNNVSPNILDGLDYEHQFIQRTSGSQRRVVKLNRGDSWLLRFLPATLGPNARWYARIAKHWVNMRAIICPRHTEEAFGGHPEAYCSVCELAEHLNSERHEEVSKFGFKLRANANWVTYCAVFEKATQGGQSQPMALPEVLQPYEFAHYKTSWEELIGFVKAGQRRCEKSVFDFEKGNDFHVSKTNKGLRLDKQDSGPIFDLNDPNFDANCQKLLAACKDPVVKIPDEQAMDTFADKAQEEANNIARGRSGAAAGGRGARAPRGDEDDLPPEDDQPPARGGGGRQYAEPQQEAAPARARTAAPAPAAAPARRAAAPPAAAPARAAAAAPARAAAPAAAPARRAAAPPPPPEPEQEAPPEDQGDPGAEGDQPVDGGEQLPADDGGDQPPEEQQQQQPEPPAPAPVRRAPVAAAAAPARTAASRPGASRPNAAPARTAAPAAAPARTAAPARGGAPAQESLDENEHIPEEANDQAPPAPLVDPADDTGAGEAPPAVENTRRGQFASSIRTKVAAANASVKK
jgi:hypothetical protein